jgi:hypothetical protein
LSLDTKKSRLERSRRQQMIIKGEFTMDEWNEEFLAVEVEREIEKHNAEREKWNLEPSATATGTSSVWRILLGLLIGLTILIMVCLFLIK